MNAKDLENVECGRWGVIKGAAANHANRKGPGPQVGLILGADTYVGTPCLRVFFEGRLTSSPWPVYAGEILSLHGPGGEGHKAAVYAMECFGMVGKFGIHDIHVPPFVFFVTGYLPDRDLFKSIKVLSGEPAFNAGLVTARFIMSRPLYPTREEAEAALEQQVSLDEAGKQDRKECATCGTMENVRTICGQCLENNYSIVRLEKQEQQAQAMKRAGTIANDAYREGFKNGEKAGIERALEIINHETGSLASWNVAAKKEVFENLCRRLMEEVKL